MSTFNDYLDFCTFVLGDECCGSRATSWYEIISTDPYSDHRHNGAIVPQVVPVCDRHKKEVSS